MKYMNHPNIMGSLKNNWSMNIWLHFIKFASMLYDSKKQQMHIDLN